jgi:O-antigen ligase
LDALINFSIKYLHARVWIPIWLSLAVLAYPLSLSVHSFCLGITLIDILSIGEYRKDLVGIFSTTWFKATLFLVGLALIACLWSPASLSKIATVFNKYIKIIYLPILVIGFHHYKTREVSIHAFLLAMLITSVISILRYHGYLLSFNIEAEHVFRNHIITGLLVSFATYLSLLLCTRQQGYKIIPYGLLALVFSYHVLYINGGRTGYVLYFLLMLLLVLQTCTKRQAIAGIVFIGLLFTGNYISSSLMRVRINAIPQQIIKYQQNIKDTQIGYRLQFHDFAHQLFNQHPIRGNGTGSFGYYFGLDKTQPIGFSNLLEPHSQYWLAAAEFGLLGVLALLFFFMSLIQASRKLNKMKPIAFAVILTFMLGSLSDSLLFYSSSGYFFILFMALCLGEWLEDKKMRLSNVSIKTVY